ncbi:MAG TPA: hypothetical protein DCS93_20875 [Microscillaceae bacterium]|nr:hypothetical protein [Microscillaceae bacterium]
MEYGFFDGDSIGTTLEGLLRNDKIADASNLSSMINIAMQEIKEYLDNIAEYEIIIFGGDDLLIKTKNEKISQTVIDKIRQTFFKRTGCTISGGIGSSIIDAMNKLGKAKDSGRNKVLQ